MVKITCVDSGDSFQTDENSVEGVLDFIYSHTGNTADSIFLLSPEGKPFTSNCKVESLFMFKRESPLADLPVFLMPVEHFTRYPSSDFYHEPFDFSQYEFCNSAYADMELIERELFDCSIKARRLFAEYKTRKKYLMKGKKLIAVRLNAGYALLCNVENYYNSVEAFWEETERSAMDLQKEIVDLNRVFEQHLRDLETKPQMKALFEANPQFKRFGNDLARKVNILCYKITSMKNQSLNGIKDRLQSSFESHLRVEATVQNMVDKIDDSSLLDQEGLFLEGLEACSDHYVLREDLRCVCDENYSPKTPKADGIMKMRPLINKNNNKQKELVNFITKFDAAIDEMEENLKTRVRRFYSLQVIECCAFAVHKLKFEVKEKLVHYQREMQKYIREKEYLLVPAKMEEALDAVAQEMTLNSNMLESAMGLIQELYEEIADDQEKSDAFASKFARILPAEMFPELNSKSNELKIIHKLYPELPTQTPLRILPDQEVSEEELLEYYTNLIDKMEREIKTEFTDQNIENEIETMKKVIVNQSKERDRLYRTINNYSLELEILKRNRQGDSRRFLDEVRTLKLREEKLKKIHLQKLKQSRRF